MPTLSASESKRRIHSALQILTPERVVELAERQGLPVESKSVGKLRRAILGRGGLSEERLMHFLSVFELQELCAHLGLPSHGRDVELLRNRVLGRENATVSAIKVDIPQELRAEKTKRGQQFALRRIRHGFSRSAGTLFWATAAGAVAYFSCTLLMNDEQVLEYAAMAGAGVGVLCRIFRLGRFRALLLFGGAMIGGTFFAYDSDIIKFAEGDSGQWKLALVWAVGGMFGAVMGIAEEAAADMR